MKQLKNAKIQKIGNCLQAINSAGKILFEGDIQKKYRIDEGFPLVWILKDAKGIVRSFIELKNQNVILVGPTGVTQAKAQDNYLLFEKKGCWYGQYFSKSKEIYLGQPVNLREKDGLGNFLFIQPNILYCAEENKLQAYNYKSYERVEFIDDSDERLLMMDERDRVFLFDNLGKFEPEGRNVLFCRKGANEGFILLYLWVKNSYKILYQGKYLQNYHINEFYIDGVKTDTTDVDTWSAKDMFIVPDDDKAMSGTLFKIEQNKVKEMAHGKLCFVTTLTSRKHRLPLDESFVKIGEQKYKIY